MFAFNAVEFSAISAKCPGQNSRHKHAQWGLSRGSNGFATAEETAYPMGLAKLIAVIFLRVLIQCNIQHAPETLEQVQPYSLQALQKMRAATGTQSRASRMPPPVRTYKSKFHLKGHRHELPQVAVLQRLKEPLQFSSEPVQRLPKGARLLAIQHAPSETNRGEETEGATILTTNFSMNFFRPHPDDCNVFFNVGTKDETDEKDGPYLQTWGLPWDPDEFVLMASKAGHPAGLESFLPPRMASCIDTVMSMTEAYRMQHRARTLKHWLRRSIELRKDEKSVHESLHADVARVLHGKKILLWEEMLSAINYEDMGVVEEFKTGTMLTGCAPITGLWPTRFTPATATEDDVRAMAKVQRQTLSYKSVVFFEKEIAESVWGQTMDEVSRGELEGPMEIASIPDHIPLSKRFGVKQGQKTRCVDDFSASGVNSASQVSESPKPHTLDVVGGMLASVMAHQSKPTQWMIRGFDLKNAYRQCAISPSSSDFSYIVVGDPSCEKLYAFKMRALPFGSVRSVHSFLRVANSLWSILSSLFLVVNSNYFDDFVALASKPEADSVDHTVKTVLKLLGWVFAQYGPKAPPFAADARVLGVQINVEHMGDGKVEIDNTAARRAELAEVIRRVLSDGHLPRMEALRLRGRMQFASGQLFGRVAKRTLAIVTQHAYSAESAKLSPEAMASMHRFLSMMESDKPRSISKNSS